MRSPVELTVPSGKDARHPPARTDQTHVALPPENLPASPDDKRARAQAAQEDVLLREVDEAVRQDQYADAARKYGRVIAIAVIAVLLGFAR